MCNKDIYYYSKDLSTSIHFDHRDGGNEPIKENPCTWLAGKFRNPINEAIWKASNFGMLCGRCNALLPTINRVQFLKNAVKYVLGKDLSA